MLSLTQYIKRSDEDTGYLPFIFRELSVGVRQ